uniref:Corticotropin-releasing factor domain-containing protein n=1 Tax=Anser cygnoides TaxID=8845 RepID=A0A8B9EQG4_ANSCY
CGARGRARALVTPLLILAKLLHVPSGRAASAPDRGGGGVSPAAHVTRPRPKGRCCGTGSGCGRRRRCPWVSLSLDVPTHILKILLDLAREKELQAKAAANAELMARIGRRR